MPRFELIADITAGADERCAIHGELKPPPGGDFNFVIISDRTGGAVYQMFERGLEVAASLRPEFILPVGDLVEGYWTDEAEAEAEWDRIDPLLDSVGAPILLTPGNHDYGTQAMVDVWHRRKGASHYAVRYGPVLVLVANSEAIDNLATSVPDAVQRWNRYNIHYPRQHTAIAYFVRFGAEAAARTYPDLFDKDGVMIRSAWSVPDDFDFIRAFDEQLAASDEFRDPLNLINPGLSDPQLDFFEGVLDAHADAAWTFVSMHQPAWKKPDARFERLEAMLADRRYTMVAGHTHLLEVETRRDRAHIALGKTGGLHCFDGPGDIHHVALVCIRDGKPTIEIVQYDNEIERLPLAQFHSR